MQQYKNQSTVFQVLKGQNMFLRGKLQRRKDCRNLMQARIGDSFPRWNKAQVKLHIKKRCHHGITLCTDTKTVSKWRFLELTEPTCGNMNIREKWLKPENSQTQTHEMPQQNEHSVQPINSNPITNQHNSWHHRVSCADAKAFSLISLTQYLTDWHKPHSLHYHRLAYISHEQQGSPSSDKFPLTTPTSPSRYISLFKSSKYSWWHGYHHTNDNDMWEILIIPSNL